MHVKFLCCGMVSTVMCVSFYLCSPDSEGLNILVFGDQIYCALCMCGSAHGFSADMYECLLELHTDVV